MKTMFSLNGKFLGFTNIKAELKDQRSSKILAEKTMKVSVVRKKTIQSKLFSYSVAILVSLAYINMGCAMDLEVVKKTLKKPVGPLIGFICQYFIMPLISFALGYIFGAKNAPMRLGLFVTGKPYFFVIQSKIMLYTLARKPHRKKKLGSMQVMNSSDLTLF
jgi:sodium/bile acid cotransporter 3/5